MQNVPKKKDSVSYSNQRANKAALCPHPRRMTVYSDPHPVEQLLALTALTDRN